MSEQDTQETITVTEWDWNRTDDQLEAAWGIIANAHGGRWEDAPAEWREAAARWRDHVMPGLSARMAAQAQQPDLAHGVTPGTNGTRGGVEAGDGTLALGADAERQTHALLLAGAHAKIAGLLNLLTHIRPWLDTNAELLTTPIAEPAHCSAVVSNLREQARLIDEAIERLTPERRRHSPLTFAQGAALAAEGDPATAPASGGTPRGVVPGGDEGAALVEAFDSAVSHNARIAGKDAVSAYHEDEPVDEDGPRQALLAALRASGTGTPAPTGGAHAAEGAWLDPFINRIGERLIVLLDLAPDLRRTGGVQAFMQGTREDIIAVMRTAPTGERAGGAAETGGMSEKVQFSRELLRALARLCGASPATVRRWIDGTTAPHPTLQRSLLAVLGARGERDPMAERLEAMVQREGYDAPITAPALCAREWCQRNGECFVAGDLDRCESILPTPAAARAARPAREGADR